MNIDDKSLIIHYIIELINNANDDNMIVSIYTINIIVFN